MVEVAGLTVAVQPVGTSADVARVVLAGRSDPIGVQRLQQTVDGAVADGRIRLLVDCQRLEYVNSTAIGYLINLADRLVAAKGKLALLHVSPAVRKVFEVLGLKDYFPTFSNEGEALGHLTKGVARAPVINPPAAGVAAPPPRPVPKPPLSPATPSPLDPLRWIVFLRAVAEKVDAAVIPDLCRRLQLSADGGTVQAATQILKRVRTAEEFLRFLEPRTLAASCALYGLPKEGEPNALVDRIVALVQKASTADLSRALEAAAAESADLPLELNLENLLNLLEHTALARRGAAGAVATRLTRAFGRDKVRKNRRAGSLGWGDIDLEVDGRFGIVLVAANALLKKGTKAAKGIQAFLGRLAVAARHYGRGKVIAVLTGKVSSAQAPALEEARALAADLGVKIVVQAS